MLAITKGWYQMPYKMLNHDGSTAKEEKGGFHIDPLRGQLWALVDTDDNKVIDASFDIKKVAAAFENEIEKRVAKFKEEQTHVSK